MSASRYLEFPRWLGSVRSLAILVCLSATQSATTGDEFWVRTNGPFGGAVWALTAGPNGDLYAGARAGTIFRYSAIRGSWLPMFAGATRQDVISMVADRERLYFVAQNNGGTFLGYPATNSWKKLEGGPDTTELYGLAVDSERRLLAAARSGLFRYDPRDGTWTGVNEVQRAFGFFVSGPEIYAIGDGMSRSSDGGRTWSRVTAPSGYLTAMASDGETLYAGSRTGDVFQRDSGGDWRKLHSFPRNSVSALGVGKAGRLLIALSGPAFSSEGGGLHAIRRGDPGPKLLFDDDSNSVARILTHKEALFIGTNEGVWRSTDGGTRWAKFNRGLIAQRLNDLLIDRSDAIYAGSYGGVFRSIDNGRNWTERNKGLEQDMGILDMAVNSRGHLFLGTYLTGIYRSVDSGASWQQLKTGIARTSGNWIMNLAVNSRNHVFACVLEAGIFRSPDNGDTWAPVAGGVFHDNCHALAIDSKGRIYAGNSKGDLFRSDDDGMTWRKLPASNPPPDDPSLLVVDKEDRVYFGGSEKGLFRYSEDDGRWVSLNEGLPNPAIRSLLFVGDSLFVGTSGANDYQLFDGNDIFHSPDWGSTWSKQSSGLGHPRVKALAVNSKGVLFAGTWGGGVYRSTRPVRPE